MELLSRDQWHVIRLRGAPIVDAEAFFRQAALDLPQPSGLEARGSWDALVDNLWEQLYTINKEKIAVVWDNAQKLLQADLQSFVEVIDVFSFLGRSLIDTKEHAISLTLIVSGEGANFPSFQA